MLSPQEHHSRILNLEIALMVQPPLLSPITAQNVCTHLAALHLDLDRIIADLAGDMAALNTVETTVELCDYQEQWLRAVRLGFKLDDKLTEAQAYLAMYEKTGQQEDDEDQKP